MPLTTTFDPGLKNWWRLVRRNTQGLQKDRMVSLIVNPRQGVSKPQTSPSQNKPSHLMTGIEMAEADVVECTEYR